MDIGVSERPAHSPLGASGAERWMHCPGSVALLKELRLENTDEPDYRSEGTAAHEAIHHCLTAVEGQVLDAWEVVGLSFNGIEITSDIAAAIQVFLDECRAVIADAVVWGSETPIDAPDFHPDFYGTIDFWAITRMGNDLHVKDYKHGIGIAVDVTTPQIKYYAYGVLRNHPDVECVHLSIVQPRGFHEDGPIRGMSMEAADLAAWADGVLLPAMSRTQFDQDLDAGSWCRFCPAKLVCPLMTSLFGTAATCNPKEVIELTDESLGRSYEKVQAVKFYLKAMEEEIFARLQKGRTMAQAKLVAKKANRVFKDGALTVFQARFGDDVWLPRESKSPAEMAKISPEADKLVKEWAYTPQGGLTVAPISDKRIAIKVNTSEEAFAATIEKLTAED